MLHAGRLVLTTQLTSLRGWRAQQLEQPPLRCQHAACNRDQRTRTGEVLIWAQQAPEQEAAAVGSAAQSHLLQRVETSSLSRRAAVAALGGVLLQGVTPLKAVAEVTSGSTADGSTDGAAGAAVGAEPSVPDWTRAGPFKPVRLPRLEHTCSSCFPLCVGDQCLLRIDAVYPKGGLTLGMGPPYPLAIFSAGFLVSGLDYLSYAQRLASWGFTVLLYDKVESAVDSLTDVVSVRFIRDLIDWAASDPILSALANTSRVYLAGHSRGAKLSVLAAAADPRVAAVCLVDPVDNTVYAPLGPLYPSAVVALHQLGTAERRQPVPVAVIGSGLGGDCVPRGANHALFFEACSAPAWEVVIRDCGHFQFLDQQSPLFRAVCAAGKAPDDTVRSVAQAVMVAWGETMVRGQGTEPTPVALDESGNTVASNVTLNRTQALFRTEEAVTRLLQRTDASAGPVPIVSRLKNVSLIVESANPILSQSRVTSPGE